MLLLITALAGSGLTAAVRADETPTPPVDPPSNPAADSVAARNQQKIMETLRRLEKKFGRDAVLLSGYALSLAVRHGAILEAEANLRGYEERGGQRFLTLHLASGIVFNDNDHSAAQRPMRVWTNIIEPSLRQLAEGISVGAEGVAFHVTYAHKAYKDEYELRDHLKDGRGDQETAKYFVRVTDVTEMLAQRLSGQQLADRATILVNDQPTQLTLEPTPAPKQLIPPSELETGGWFSDLWAQE